MTDVADALGLVQRGWPVFPGELSNDGKKVPIGHLVESGFKDATLHPKRVMLWWKVRPDAIAAVALPRDTVALDVDDVEAFSAAGLELPDGPGQQTPRGGYHRLFRTDGRRVRQTVKEVPGSDTRVGGLGYVFAWQPEKFPEADSLPMAPEWLYDQDRGTAPEQDSPLVVRRVRRGKEVEVATIVVGQRDNELARVAGGMRKMGLGPNGIYAAFKAMLADGQIESPADDPITDKDLRRIAGSIGTRQSDAVDRQSRPEITPQSGQDLRPKKFDPLHEFVEDLLPEGFGLVGGAPKVGKSWMMLQLALCVSTRTEFLGRDVSDRDVLYYALEDGERRLQSRIGQLLGEDANSIRPDINLAKLHIMYSSPRLSEGLEEDIDKWLTRHPRSLVVVDVLAKVRPSSRGRGSAYDEDYSILTPLNEVCKSNKGSAIAVVTHTRKMGAEDPFATFQGTMGTIGSADWAWKIARKRFEEAGTLELTSRDVGETTFGVRFNDGLWTVDGTLLPGMPEDWNETAEYVKEHGPVFAKEIAEALGEERTTVQNRLGRMEKKVPIRRTDQGYLWVGQTEVVVRRVSKSHASAPSESRATAPEPGDTPDDAASEVPTRVRATRAGPGRRRSRVSRDSYDSDNEEQGDESRETRVTSPARDARTRARIPAEPVEGVEGVELVEPKTRRRRDVRADTESAES